MERIKPEGNFAPQHTLSNERVRSLEEKEVDWQARFGLVVISGKPGAGTSSAARILAEKYSSGLYKAGDTIRELGNNQERVPSGFIQRAREVDYAVDERVRRMVMDANIKHPQIAEAQIGSLTALETQMAIERTGKMPNAPIVRILIWATKEERIKRLKKASDLKGQNKTIEQIRYETTIRERDDIEHWKELYPTLIGEYNPLEKDAKDAMGNLIYNIEIDNSDLDGEEETAKVIHMNLARMGLIMPIERQTPLQKAS